MALEVWRGDGEAGNRLAEAATELHGYEGRTVGPLARREAPIARVVVIVDLGPGVWVASDPEAPRYALS